MALDLDDEILQDFLVEAGEILELLGEQLVDLEQAPDDKDLLNAVFRGFHTIKGGASFVGLTAMVEVCHVAEDVFNLLRQGERQVDAHLMDVILRVVDAVNEMFDEVRSGKEPASADPELIRQLKEIQAGKVSTAASSPPQPSTVVEEPATTHTEPVSEILAEPVTQVLSEPLTQVSETEPVSNLVDQNKPFLRSKAESEDITDTEFEKILDVLQEERGGPPGHTTAPASSSDEEITEDEFEQLLDTLHGKGKHGGTPNESDVGEDISEEEFENLLDQLHGKGKHVGAPASAAPEVSASPKASAPVTEPVTEVIGVTEIKTGSEDISEEEFEKLLDELHGKGKHGGVPSDQVDDIRKRVEAFNQEEEKVAAAPVAPAAAMAVEPVEPTPPASSPKPQSTNTEPSSKTEKAKASKEAAQAESTVRVDTKRLDDIMNMVGELVLVRNRLVTLEAALQNEEVAQAVGNLDLVTADLQTAVMKTRMQPIKKVFGRFPRVVRDLARSLKKDVKLELEGEETDLDKNLVEALADPLVHLVRNAVDHGIEMPDVREQAGKERQGTVVLSAEQEGDHILLTIKDDGAGMDPNVLRNKAIEKGILDEDSAARLSDKDCYDLIFAPGFSTKTEISDISGRGVGMDVVKTRIVQLNGSIDIDSKKGKGSKLVIKVPLTLAIMPTLMVMLEKQIFALPLVSVSEIFNLDLTQTNRIDGQEVIMLRERPLPIFYLKDWLVRGGRTQEHPPSGHVVVVSVGNQKVGFVVEHLIGQEEVVIKPLGAMLQGTMGLSGATITGDGRIALILDVPNLIKANSVRNYA
ncbi:MAG: chemotaxis protein CheA [Gammaproteobacteria bacterium]|nr:chemotaxis protein CheA [Gammaproteobacteria bacterium]